MLARPTAEQFIFTVEQGKHKPKKVLINILQLHACVSQIE